MSPGIQSQNAIGNPGLMNRGESYSYTLHRGPFTSLSGLNDMSRYSPYTSTPRALDSTVDRPQNLMFGHTGNMFIEPMQRLSQPMADAPPFNDTCILHPIVSGNQTIKPEIQAKIHKNFFQVDEKWTCYRRNYFSVSCSFSLHPFSHSPVFVKSPDNQGTQRIQCFAMSISAIVNAQYGEARELVQHTPKRDKQSERKPGKVVLQPSQPPPLVLGHGSSNNNPLGFSLGSQTGGIGIDYNSYTNTANPSQPPTQHTFERIQFQKATANNGKRRAQQQYYNLVVELYAEVPNPMVASETQWVKVARRLSHPMVVRGRSPGHYKDGRRDSTTSMGPDGSSGGAGDGSGAVLPPSIGPAARSHLSLMSYDTQRGGTHYCSGDYRQMAGSEQSPTSDSPLMSSSSSSAFDISMLNESMDPMDAIKGAPSTYSYHQGSTFAVTSPERKLDGFRSHLPYEYETLKGEEPGGEGHFPEAFDSMVPMMSNGPSDSQYMKQPSRSQLTGIEYADGTVGRYDPVHGQICT